MRKLINRKMQNVSRSGEKGGPACGWWKVECCMLGNRKVCWYVDVLPLKSERKPPQASGLLSDSLPFIFIRVAIRSIHPLCSPRSTPTWPFDVKPSTYEPIGLIPTCEPLARTDHERQLIVICVSKGKHTDVTNTPFIKISTSRLQSQFSPLIPAFPLLPELVR